MLPKAEQLQICSPATAGFHCSRRHRKRLPFLRLHVWGQTRLSFQGLFCWCTKWEGCIYDIGTQDCLPNGT